MKTKTISLKALLVLSTLFLSGQSNADQLPDAGRLLREQPKAPALAPATPQTITPDSTASPVKDLGPRFLVKGFRIEGATLIPEEELIGQIEDAVGKELGFYQLNALTLRLTGYYREKGYVARVILPPQDVKDGIVLIKIVEGHRGSLNIENKGIRLDPERVRGFVDYRLPEGKNMDLSALGTALDILNEQPGIQATSRLASGKDESAVDVIVTAEDKPLTKIYLGTNNHGSRGTGEGQLTGSVLFNNPFGLFDAASVLVNATQGIRFLRGEYGLAIGNSGLRGSVNVSALDYDITQDSLDALNAHGNAYTAGLGLSYPLIRRSNLSLSLTGNYDRKTLHDYALGSETNNRDINAFGVGLVGTTTDNSFGFGQTGFALGMAGGNVSINNPTAKAVDDLTRETDGQYAKLTYYLSRNQLLSSHWMLAANLSGQFAADNLDSTERFALGGPNGVRAYPVGEGIGDEGVLASVNLVYTFNERFNVSAFVDGGRIRLNKDTWANWNAGNPRLDNTYSLSGGGFALNWIVAERVALNAIVATPFGNNPGRDANGNDLDNRSLGVRGWVSLTTAF